MLMAALAFGFTACEDDDTNALPQSNPQEPLMTVEGVSVAPGIAVTEGATDLLATATAGEKIAVLQVVEAANLPANAELEFVMQISKSEDYSTSQEVATVVTDNVVYVDPIEWQAAHLAEMGKNPKAQTTYLRFAAYAVNGTSSVRLGGPDYYIGQGSLSVTPYPAEIFIDEAYYLEVNGEVVEQFGHSGDVYDNPVFVLKLDVSVDEVMNGWEWRVLSKSYVDGNTEKERTVFAPADDFVESTEGDLVTNVEGVEPQAGILVQDGLRLLTVNVETLSFAFTSAVENLYTPGDANGWNQTASQMLYTNDYVNYMGYAVLAPGGFKFTNAPDWNHTNYGDGGEAGMLSTDGGAGNLTVPEKGLYWCSVDIGALTYSTTQVVSIGVIGDATPAGWDADTDLTSEDFLVWKGTVALKGSGELKFRANDGWDINLGGDVNNLSAGGANIPTPGEGNWEVTLDLSKLPYSCTFTKK
jgi:hypothetical protein